MLEALVSLNELRREFDLRPANDNVPYDLNQCRQTYIADLETEIPVLKRINERAKNE